MRHSGRKRADSTFFPDGDEIFGEDAASSE